MRDCCIKQRFLLGSKKKMAGPPAEGHVPRSQTPENECQDVVEKPAPAKMKEGTTDSLGAGTVGAPATFESSVPTNWKKK
jgi:hypothetical protein